MAGVLVRAEIIAAVRPVVSLMRPVIALVVPVVVVVMVLAAAAGAMVALDQDVILRVV